MTDPILEFQGQYRFLSNFWGGEPGQYNPLPRTVEHYFQAAKTINPAERARVLAAPTPGQAKTLGRGVTLRQDWDYIKNDVMLHCLRKKFLGTGLTPLLLGTEDAALYEGNTWGDTYWGIDMETGDGKNWLGHLLMKVRTEADMLNLIEEPF